MALPEAYVTYKASLPIRRGGGTAWTIESFAIAVPLRYPGFSLVEGQEWEGLQAKYKILCPEHGKYETYANDFLRDRPANRSGCKACGVEVTSQVSKDRTRALVGTTNVDGVKALEVRWSWVNNAALKNGGQMLGRLRCQCPVCSNDQWWVIVNNFQIPGHSTHCGCLSKKDGALKFSKNIKAASAPCHLYIFNTIAATAWKVGITNNLKSRPSKSYEGLLWTTDPMPRAHAWAIEQILHYNLRAQGLQVTEDDLDEIDCVWNKGEGGRSELFTPFDLDTIVDVVKRLRAELDTCSWIDLLDRYIPFDEMLSRQRYRWDVENKRVIQRQPSCEKFRGLLLPSLFMVM